MEFQAGKSVEDCGYIGILDNTIRDSERFLISYSDPLCDKYAELQKLGVEMALCRQEKLYL